MRNHILQGLIIMGAGVFLLGIGSVSPAHADRYSDANRAVHHDLDIIRRDEGRLHDLMHKRADQHFRGDWRGERNTSIQIDRARLDLEHDHELLRLDRQQLDRFEHRY